MIEIRRPRSWTQLQSLLFDDPWPNRAGEFHSNMVHRGMLVSTWNLDSTLLRRGLVDVERHLVRNFRKYAETPRTQISNAWDWLVLAQHHGLPTRLLDWTYSPWVALHFATDHPQFGGQDGVVWSVDFRAIHDALPRDLQAPLRAEGAGAFTTSMLEEAVPDPLSLTGGDGFLIFEPPSIDQRVVNQYAGMSVALDPRTDLQAYLESFPETIARKTLVPARLKSIVRERLDQANITERLIYPGLDGLAAWLIRYYSTPRRDWIGGPTVGP